MGATPNHATPMALRSTAPKRTLGQAVRTLLADDPTTLLAVLYGIALDERSKPADRITATRELLDRGYGKPVNVSLVAEAGEGTKLDTAIRDLLNGLAHPDIETAPAEIPSSTSPATTTEPPALPTTTTTEPPALPAQT